MCDGSVVGVGSVCTSPNNLTPLANEGKVELSLPTPQKLHLNLRWQLLTPLYVLHRWRRSKLSGRCKRFTRRAFNTWDRQKDKDSCE